MSTRIPQANPKAENDELALELDQAIQNVLKSGRYILGPEVEAFEKEFANYIGVRYGIGVASGTDAICIALRALNVKEGDEVITVSHTAVASVSAIEQCGAVPVLADIVPDTFTMDPSCLENLINEKTRVIMPVHLYGHPANIEAILEIARKYGLYVLEDCAQAHGAAYQGKKLGSWGHIAAFSFYPTKNLGAIGDGGMVVTDDAEIAERVQLLRQYGWRERYVSQIPGINSRLDEIQSALLRVKLHHLDKNNARRRHLAGIYNELLNGSVALPVEQNDCYHVYHLYVIRTSNRNLLQSYLKERGIGSLVHYPVPVHLQPAYQGRLKTSGLPVTESVADEILSLPLYPQMMEEDVRETCKVIKEFLNVGQA